ncbi:unnamed protein product [Kuraishia capsulata CBS 1993]|uniref:Uncharacterized protein n=1 Tax=Kuraishia capsulata CBS 1993 TaxID=1382522 RepID=W6MMM1_9ASCO|nr:unnamed protein product [Kuraishia capsulata CBS 1993]
MFKQESVHEVIDGM